MFGRLSHGWIPRVCYSVTFFICFPPGIKSELIPHSLLTTMATVHPSRMALVPQDSKSSYPDRDRRRPRSRSPRRSRSRDRDSRREVRRGSPAYDDYRRASPPPRGDKDAPWKEQGNMYPNRKDGGERDKPPHQGGVSFAGGRGGGDWGGGGGGSEYMEGYVRDESVIRLGSDSIFPTVGDSSEKQQF